MWKKPCSAAFAGTSLLWLMACSGPMNYGMPRTTSAALPYDSSSATVSGYGVVQSIDLVQDADSSGASGSGSGIDAGTIGGALVGGLLGNQIGSGSGRTAATIAGAAGGALAGREVERNMQRNQANQALYRITLRMDNGSLQSVLQATPPAVRIGDRVRVINGVIS